MAQWWSRQRRNTSLKRQMGGRELVTNWRGHGLGSEVKEFWGSGTRFVERRWQKSVGKVVVITSRGAGKLYQQRGRWARPFSHVGMGGLTVIGLTLAPVVATGYADLFGDEFAQVGGVRSTVLAADAVEVNTVESEKPRDKVYEYTVLPGDTVSGIADKFGVSMDTIRWQNNLSSINAIKPGQVLQIPPETGLYHKVKKGETIYSIAKKYKAEPQAMVDFPFNSFTNDETFALAIGQELFVPGGEKEEEQLWSPRSYVAQRTPDAGVVTASGQFVWPVGGTISQRYAWYHKGIDIANRAAPGIVAADSGTVIVAGWPDRGGYGNRVMIDHGNGFVTLYAHLQSVNVSVGQSVNRGDVIGRMGSTGRSTGIHLHFEIRSGGTAVNPLGYLK